MASPGPWQRVRYLLGRPLPEPMRPWVRNDLVGPGWIRRYVVRCVTPLLPILAAFWFVPGPVVYRLAMMLFLLLPLLYFMLALVQVYRRHLLSSNGLDPSLVRRKRRVDHDEIAVDHENRHRAG